MKRIAVLTTSAALLLAGSGLAIAGGQYGHEMKQSQAEMKAKTTVVDGAVASPDHTTLVKCIQAADLVETLNEEGPYTVFAPTNAAFDALGEDTVNSLMKPENKAQLTEIVVYHVVPGRIDSKTLAAKIKEGNGRAELTTVRGHRLTAQQDANGGIELIAANGSIAKVTAADMRHSNGVIHVVNAVLQPE